MKTRYAGRGAALLLCTLLGAPCWCAAPAAGAPVAGTPAAGAPAAEYYDSYGLAAGAPELDLGVQPLGYPSGVISTVMRHDRRLRAALAAAGHPLKTHGFRRGADMLGLLAEHRLKAGLLGDMPTILAAAGGKLWIVGLVKQSSTAIVARGGSGALRDLAGKRIGYVPASSAHNTLLQGLSAGGLGEADVRMVQLDIAAMPEALANGSIDAFAAWEPAPSIALADSAQNRIVFRGLSSDYFVIDRDFERRAPDAARLLVAGFVRAIEWMRRSRQNVMLAARWSSAEAAAFNGKASAVSPAQIAAITQREILSVPSAPAIPAGAPGTPAPLQGEFAFLLKLGKLPPGGTWEGVAHAFDYAGLRQVMSDPRRFELHVFDYEP